MTLEGEPKAEAEGAESEEEILRERGYRPEWHGMLICPICYELYEEEPVDGNMQLCSCQKRDDEPRWPGYDFNQKAMLCRCCGLEVLRSGSRWAPFFCQECRLMAIGVSVWHQRLIFPIGRHTLMHTWLPRTVAPNLAAYGGNVQELVEAFAANFEFVSNGTDRLWSWYRMNMPQNLKHFGFEGGTRLHAYLLAIVHEEGGQLDRTEAFNELCQFFRTIPTEKRGN